MKFEKSLFNNRPRMDGIIRDVAEIFMKFVPILMMKTDCILPQEGLVFSWKNMKNGVFILGIIIIIIISKINKF